MAFTVGLRGYPEAVLATDSVRVELPHTATASTVVRNLADRSARLRTALVHDDGTPRKSTMVLVKGEPVDHSTPVGAEGSVTVLAALPCDG